MSELKDYEAHAKIICHKAMKYCREYETPSEQTQDQSKNLLHGDVSIGKIAYRIGVRLLYSMSGRKGKKTSKPEKRPVEKKPVEEQANETETKHEKPSEEDANKRGPRVEDLEEKLESMKKSDRYINIAVVLIIVLLYLGSFLWRERKRSQFVSET